MIVTESSSYTCIYMFPGQSYVGYFGDDRKPAPAPSFYIGCTGAVQVRILHWRPDSDPGSCRYWNLQSFSKSTCSRTAREAVGFAACQYK